MIHGQRVRLRAIERDDLPRFVEWLNDSEVISGLVFYLPMSLAEEIRWFEKLEERPAEERPLAIDVQKGEIWVHVGSCGLDNIEWTHRSAELGIVIGDKRYWNQGYGSQVMRLLLQHGFGTLNLYRIYLRVYETNARAIHLYEKIGFVHEGRMRQALYRQGQYHDILLMSILRSEWDASKRES